ncbi:MAG: hypothetical protein J5911_05685 [Clostridia bacterium]|nr:hypothetical protein [Clostridia bacterium]
MEFELLQQGFVTIVLSGCVSVSLLQEELSVSAEVAKDVIKELSAMGVISGFDYSKDKMPFIRKSDLQKQSGGADGQNTKENLKDFCTVDTNVSIHTLKPVMDEPISEDLIEKAKGLKVKYDKLTTLILQKELKIGYSDAIRILDVIDGAKNV